jgi:hypothetical protein
LKWFPQLTIADSSAADSNRRQTTSRFDNLAGFGQVDRPQGDPEGVRRVQRRIIRPGARFSQKVFLGWTQSIDYQPIRIADRKQAGSTTRPSSAELIARRATPKG